MHGQNENKYSNDIAILENHEYLATALKIYKIMQYVMIIQFNSRVNIYLVHFLIDCLLLWIQLYKMNAMKM